MQRLLSICLYAAVFAALFALFLLSLWLVLPAID